MDVEAMVKVDRRQGNPPAVRWTRCRWECHTYMERNNPISKNKACKQQGKKGTILVILTHIAVLPESMRRVSCDM